METTIEVIEVELKAAVAPKKLHRTATMIVDKAKIAELNGQLPIQKDGDKPRNGFWALASVEMPQGDSDGDIIVVGGIQADLDPETGKYVPLLPSHMMKMPDGKAAEIGRIERLVKTQVDGVPALAMYFTFALDEAGQPIDDLVGSYYKRYTLGYSNSFSVGMDCLSEPEPIKGGGWKFNSTKLLEVSAVSIPANSGALGITRSKADEDQVLALITKCHELLSKMNISEEFTKAFKPLEDRLDILEAGLVAKADTVVEQPQPSKDKDSDLVKELDRVLSKYAK